MISLGRRYTRVCLGCIAIGLSIKRNSIGLNVEEFNSSQENNKESVTGTKGLKSTIQHLNCLSTYTSHTTIKAKDVKIQRMLSKAHYNFLD